MRLQVFHQLGFHFNWNFQSLAKDNTGDGVILAPRYMERELIEEDMEPRDLEISLFDPQFFLPATAKGALATYPFFPDVVAAGFSTSEFPTAADDFSPAAAEMCARGCVRFQLRNRFPRLVIPTRYLEGVPSDYIQKQSDLFVEPFLRAIREESDRPPVLLQLILTDLMLKEPEYTADLLNWITGIPELAGVYLIISPTRRGKQLKDMQLLHATLRFIAALSRNEMEVVVGYTNTEALLLSIASPRAVTIGCYENMRMFNIRTFEDGEKPTTHGPVPRVYVSRLLQWVDHRYIPFIRRTIRPGEILFDENEYQALMFQPSFNWHFSKSELYKHAMLEFWRQLRAVGDLEGRERYELVRDMLRKARDWYVRFDEAGIELDDDSDGSHLPAWLTVANTFASEEGWR